MRIAMRVASNSPQAKTTGLVIACGFQAAIVKHQHFRMAHFKEQFAIVSRCQRIADNFLGARQIQSGFIEEYGVGLLQKIHEITFKNSVLKK